MNKANSFIFLFLRSENCVPKLILRATIEQHASVNLSWHILAQYYVSFLIYLNNLRDVSSLSLPVPHLSACRQLAQKQHTTSASRIKISMTCIICPGCVKDFEELILQCEGKLNWPSKRFVSWQIFQVLSVVSKYYTIWCFLVKGNCCLKNKNAEVF